MFPVFCPAVPTLSKVFVPPCLRSPAQYLVQSNIALYNLHLPNRPSGLSEAGFSLPSFSSHLHWKVSKSSVCLNRLLIHSLLSHFLHSHEEFLCAHFIQQDALRVLTYFQTASHYLQSKVQSPEPGI